MLIEKIVYEVNDFESLKNELSDSANKTLEAIEEKEKEEEFIDFINNIIQCDVDAGKPMTLTELDDFIDYETDYIEQELNCKLWED